MYAEQDYTAKMQLAQVLLSLGEDTATLVVLQELENQAQALPAEQKQQILDYVNIEKIIVNGSTFNYNTDSLTALVISDSTLLRSVADNPVHIATGIARSLLNKAGLGHYRETIKLPNPNSFRITEPKTFTDNVSGSDVINVYPNPTSDILFVEYAFIDGFIEGNTLVVYNIKGEKVKEIEVTQKIGYAEINVADLPDGIYIISLGGNKVFSTKFSINR